MPIPADAARVRWIAALAAMAVLGGCSEQPGGGGPSAERGRQVYVSQCIACHNPDPSLAGPVGPPIKGSSRELLEAKILRGAYPQGYSPKRPTALMPAQPKLEGEIANLAAFLK